MAWAQAHFRSVDLGHRKRNERAVTIAAAMAARPGRSIPQLFDEPYDIKAAYTFFEHPRSSLDALQQPHRDLVRGAQSGYRLLLALEDTTDLIYSNDSSRDGLGSVGSGKGAHQGFWLHSVLLVGCPDGRVVDPAGGQVSVRVLGVADQQTGRRPWPKQKAGHKRLSTARLGGERETQMWERSLERMGPAPEGCRRVRVADRGADYYEYLVGCSAVGDGYVVRACYNRVLVDGGEPDHLLDRARSEAACGGFGIDLRARPGQTARRAEVSVSFTRVLVRSPTRPGGRPGTLEPIACSVVRVWEEAPPKGVEGLEWVLLTDEVVEEYDHAREVVGRYEKRWLIEEFHKALKTGMGAERLQLETVERLEAAVGMMSVVALRLLDLRERTREQADAPAEQSGLDAIELQVLRMRLPKRQIRTVRDVALAIGRLGGHMNRAGDGMPGWITLWRGMMELSLLVDGVRIAQRLHGPG